MSDVRREEEDEFVNMIFVCTVNYIVIIISMFKRAAAAAVVVVTFILIVVAAAYMFVRFLFFVIVAVVVVVVILYSTAPKFCSTSHIPHTHTVSLSLILSRSPIDAGCVFFH